MFIFNKSVCQALGNIHQENHAATILFILEQVFDLMLSIQTSRCESESIKTFFLSERTEIKGFYNKFWKAVLKNPFSCTGGGSYSRLAFTAGTMESNGAPVS